MENALMQRYTLIGEINTLFLPQCRARRRYYLNPSGILLAYKLRQGIAVEEPIRNQVLAFGHALQWITNRAIIMAEKDTVEEYYMCFREEINQLDVERFVSEVALFEDMMRNEDDPWDDSEFVKYLGSREN